MTNFMSTIHLKIITPRKIVREEDVSAVTVPTVAGEITILPRHMNLFSLLKEGIVKIKTSNKEDLLGIGGGFVETDGKDLSILVSRAYGQSEIDEKQTQKAIEEAKKILAQTKDKAEISQAEAILRRAVVDMKLIKRRKRTSMV